MNVFHVRRAVPQHDGETWRVRSDSVRSGGNEERLIIRCPHGDSEQNDAGYTITRIFAGADMAPERTNWPADEELAPFRQFLPSLYRQGYLSTPSMLPLLPPEARHANRFQEPDATWPPMHNPRFAFQNVGHRVQGQPADYDDRPCESPVSMLQTAAGRALIVSR